MKETKFKQTEVGLIPCDWDVKKIGEVCSITTGSQNTQDHDENGKYPFFVRSQEVERINKYIYDTEGVITAGDGVGTGKIFHYVNGKFGLHQRCYLMYDFDKSTSVKYFYWVFSRNFYDRVHSMTAKSSVDSVRREMIADMQIALPPIDEQKRIAQALSDVDAVISTTEKLIAKKKALKQGTMQTLLSGKMRIQNGKCIKTTHFKQTELGPIPQEWEVKSLGSITQNSSYGVGAEAIPFNGKAKYIRITDIDDDSHRFEPSPLTSPAFYENKHLVQENDLLIARTGASVGKTYLYNAKDGKLVFAGFLIKMNICGADSKFVFYSTLTKYYQDWIVSESARTGQPGVNLQQMKKLLIAIPSSKAEQTAIATVLSDMDSEIAALETKLAKYRQLKTGMMQQLLTGKVRLV
jgi:type I restriction enzyme S subunit